MLVPIQGNLLYVNPAPSCVIDFNNKVWESVFNILFFRKIWESVCNILGEGNGTPFQYSCRKIPWTEEPGRLQSMGSRRVGHDWGTSLLLSCIGEANGNSLQCSCLENPRNGGASRAAVYGVAQSRTWLKRLSSSSSSSIHISPFQAFSFENKSTSCALWSVWGQSEWPPSQSLQTINAGDSVEKREYFYTVGGNAHWYSHYGEQCGDKTGGKKKTLKKLEKKTCHMTQQSRCWAYTWRKPELKETMCTPMCIAALFIIARTWKQPRCPSADEWIKKLWYINTVEYYSAIKKKKTHLSQF